MGQGFGRSAPGKRTTLVSTASASQFPHANHASPSFPVAATGFPVTRHNAGGKDFLKERAPTSELHVSTINTQKLNAAQVFCLLGATATNLSDV